MDHKQKAKSRSLPPPVTKVAPLVQANDQVAQAIIQHGLEVEANRTIEETIQAESTYRMMNIGVGQKRFATYKQLQALAKKLNTHIPSLVWHAIVEMLKNPPATFQDPFPDAPRGSRPGFVIQVIKADPEKPATDIIIREVRERRLTSGVSFVAYSADDPNSREVAWRQAVRLAKANREMIGLAPKEYSIPTTPAVPLKEVS
jgi:hypothetical protein